MAKGARVTVRADSAIRGFRDLGRRLKHPRPALKRIGQYVAGLSKQAFRDSRDPETHQRWASLSDVTLALRKGSSSQILVNSSDLKQSIHYLITGKKVTIGSPKVYAAMQHFGGTTSPRSMIPGKKIPARPILGIDRRGETQIMKIVDRYILEGRT